MKRHNNYQRLFALAGAGALLVGVTACGDGSDNSTEPVAAEPIRIEGKMVSWDGSTAGDRFEEGATLGLYAVEGSFTADAPRYIDNARLTCSGQLFEGPSTLTYQDTESTFVAYAPYAAQMLGSGTTVAAVSVAEDQSDVARFAASDLMVATARVEAGRQGAVEMDFQRQFSRIDLSFAGAEGEALSGWEDARVTMLLRTAAEVDFAEGRVTASSDPREIRPCGTLTSDGERLSGLSLIAVPQRIEAADEVIRLQLGNSTKAYSLGEALELRSGKRYEVAVTVEGPTISVTVTERDWTDGLAIDETVEPGDDMPGNVTDIEGNSYPVVKIGMQYWMAENLRTTKLNDGTPITCIEDATVWGENAADKTVAYCYQNNDPAQIAGFGLLYNYYAVATGQLCPEGWHVPSVEEIQMMIELLGGEDVAGDKLKSTSGWKYKGDENPAYQGTNSSGFNGLPGGSREDDGTYWNFESYGYWWSSTAVNASQANGFYLYYNRPTVLITSPQQRTGYSVRCIRYRN